MMASFGHCSRIASPARLESLPIDATKYPSSEGPGHACHGTGLGDGLAKADG